MLEFCEGIFLFSLLVDNSQVTHSVTNVFRMYDIFSREEGNVMILQVGKPPYLGIA